MSFCQVYSKEQWIERFERQYEDYLIQCKYVDHLKNIEGWIFVSTRIYSILFIIYTTARVWVSKELFSLASSLCGIVTLNSARQQGADEIWLIAIAWSDWLTYQRHISSDIEWFSKECHFFQLRFVYSTWLFLDIHNGYWIRVSWYRS